MPIISRPATESAYLDLVTSYEGGSGASGTGCTSCAYDGMGNPLAVTDPRGFTTRYDRNELGEIYRTLGPAPYNFETETYYDANRNVVRRDTQDRQPSYASNDVSSAGYGQIIPTGGGTTANVPMQAGPGGSVRPGWFTNLYTFDLLDNKTQDDVDATGSTPASLVTTYLYDANQNLLRVTKPEGNRVEFDYDERNLRIAVRVGRDMGLTPPEPGAVTVTAYDGNVPRRPGRGEHVRRLRPPHQGHRRLGRLRRYGRGIHQWQPVPRSGGPSGSSRQLWYCRRRDDSDSPLGQRGRPL